MSANASHALPLDRPRFVQRQRREFDKVLKLHTHLTLLSETLSIPAGP